MKSVIKSLVAVFAVCAALVSAGAYAQGFYGELGYGYLKVDVSAGDFSDSGNVGDAGLRLGYMFTKNFGVELFGATNVSSATIGGADVSMDSAYGAYLKGQFEVAPSFELFAKVGYVEGTLKASSGTMGVSASQSDGDVSYAVGLQYAFTKNWYGQLDYAQYYNKSERVGGFGTASISIRGPSISVGYRF